MIYAKILGVVTWKLKKYSSPFPPLWHTKTILNIFTFHKKNEKKNIFYFFLYQITRIIYYLRILFIHLKGFTYYFYYTCIFTALLYSISTVRQYTKYYKTIIIKN